MSGIAALGCRNGAKVDQSLLHSMSRLLAVRGPDRQDCWCDRTMGLGHALLRTTIESENEEQPLSFEGKVWIAADARIDARSELISRLRAHGRNVSPAVPDAELILHAWHIWDKDCLDYLLGDFAFAIADTTRDQLFCARDQLGVKPLFFATGEDFLVVSSLLDCIRLHPSVPRDLNDSWICDFLLFGWNTDVAATVFENIRRLPAAHWLRWSPKGLTIERYWSATVPDEILLECEQDYVDCFRDVFRTAVQDRLRTERAVVSMSGGLDSSSIAATALPLIKQRTDGSIRAVTAVWDPVIPDTERHYASLVAEALDIPIDFVEGKELLFFDEEWDSPATQTPEPTQRSNPMSRFMMAQAQKHSRIILSGDGGDEALDPPYRYYQKLLLEGRVSRWSVDCWRHWRTFRRLAPMGVRTALRDAWREMRGRGAPRPQFPEWIDPDLEHAQNLRDRWEWYWRGAQGDSLTPRGFGAITSFILPAALDAHDVGSMHGPVETRYPFLDLRVLRLCWSVPPSPMRQHKRLLREAMNGRLPKAICVRRKQALAGDPLLALECRLPISWAECVARTPDLSRYVKFGPDQADTKQTTYSIWIHARPFELASWLHHHWRPLGEST